jgi:hypothetical protein
VPHKAEEWKVKGYASPKSRGDIFDSTAMQRRNKVLPYRRTLEVND